MHSSQISNSKMKVKIEASTSSCNYIYSSKEDKVNYQLLGLQWLGLRMCISNRAAFRLPFFSAVIHHFSERYQTKAENLQLTNLRSKLTNSTI